MPSSNDFIRQSLELHLFFARIMKEHSFFLEIGFTQKDSDFIAKADELRRAFDRLLADTISLSNGNVSRHFLQSGEVITPFTLNAELASSYYTGINIPTNLTTAISEIEEGSYQMNNPMLEEKVYMLNENAMRLVSELIDFKTLLLSKVLSCNMFTVNYPLLIDHILREAKLYYQLISRLQNNEEINVEKEAFEQEIFWNRIMAEHSKFIRGLLDPTEDALIETANNFGNEFDNLTKEAIQAMDMTMPIANITDNNLKTTTELRNFKSQGTQGILECEIRSIIIPLLGDHTIREANHYIRLLEIFKTVK